MVEIMQFLNQQLRGRAFQFFHCGVHYVGVKWTEMEMDALIRGSTSSRRSVATLSPRGPVSEVVLRRVQGLGDAQEQSAAVRSRIAVENTADIAGDGDVQLALFLIYALSYGSLDQMCAELEWDTDLIQARRTLESAFERALRERVTWPELPDANTDAVARALFTFVEADSGPSLSRYFAKQATGEQAREFLMQRSIYTLREADPHSWAIPRLRGRPKGALVEIQSDEYGGGRPERIHAELFATSMRGVGLDDAYGAYVDDVPALTLASFNMMSMFGLNRRLIGAVVGHLAAFEMTSSIPNRKYGDGFRRLGFGTDVTEYFDEHVEADAVHEQIAARDLAGALAEDQPELLADIMFGAAACLAVDGWVAGHMLEAWLKGETSLRKSEDR